MAMRVVTLNKLGDYIKDKLGRDQIMVKDGNSVRFIDSSDNSISCYLPNSQVSNLSDENPFLKFRDQVRGVLSVRGELVLEEDLAPYSYLLD